MVLKYSSKTTKLQVSATDLKVLYTIPVANDGLLEIHLLQERNLCDRGSTKHEVQFCVNMSFQRRCSGLEVPAGSRLIDGRFGLTFIVACRTFWDAPS